jgi:hypothetical protein
MTEGVTKETLDGMNREYLEKIQMLLKAGNYKFNPPPPPRGCISLSLEIRRPDL